jgi:zinc/manganese transport system substrate-binding protein
VNYRVILSLLLSSILLGAISCKAPVINQKKNIVVTYSVLGAVVKELAGNVANVIVTMPNGADPHDWQPSAKDIETINNADMVVENGLGLESGLLKTLETAKKAGVNIFTASDHINIRHVGAGEGIPSEDPDQTIGAPDPHLWLDPEAMKEIVDGLSAAILKNLNIDLSARADELKIKLDNLNSEILNMVAQLPVSERMLVTGHESMGYFARAYNFKLIGVFIPGLSSQAGISAANLAALKQTILETHVKAIFTELGTSPTVVNTIGQETGVKVVQITTHALPADGSYFTFMTNLATIISTALK